MNDLSLGRERSLVALILAGGQSRRMGCDKALLPLEGVPLLRRTCEVALTCTPEVQVMTPWPERYRGIVPMTVSFLPEVRSHFTPALGPLPAFAQALRLLTAEWVLLLACDLPALQAEPLQQGQMRLATMPEAAIATLPQTSQGWEPLCGFYHRQRCQPSLEQALVQGITSFQDWLSGRWVMPWTVDPELLTNCNTQQAWQSFIEKRPKD